MALIQCRSDPILVLADGRNIKVVTWVGTDQVTRMTVFVRGPRGTALERVLYVGPDRYPETVEYVADGSDAGFRARVTVEAPVEAQVLCEVQLRSAKAKVEGRTNAPIEVVLVP